MHDNELETVAQQHPFITMFNMIAEDIHQTAEAKGWWDEARNEGEIIALIHSEISEALEGLRAGNPPDDKVPEFGNVEVELADAVIRIMDYGLQFNYDVAGAIIAKNEFNKTREYKHGNKKF